MVPLRRASRWGFSFPAGLLQRSLGRYLKTNHIDFIFSWRIGGVKNHRETFLGAVIDIEAAGLSKAELV
jgi:hypothetical protein